jgi:hypothetical protein
MVLPTEEAVAAGAPTAAGDKLTEEDSRRLGVEAHIFGYPLVPMDVTRRVSTAVPKVPDQRAPVTPPKAQVARRPPQRFSGG